MNLRPNSYNFGSAEDQPALEAQMAGHLEHLAAVLRGDQLAHFSRDERLDYLKFALQEHSNSIVGERT